MSLSDILSLSNELHVYMLFRAKMEKVVYKLLPDFFVPFLSEGLRLIFGIQVDDKGIIADHLNPSALPAWRDKM